MVIGLATPRNRHACKTKIVSVAAAILIVTVLFWNLGSSFDLLPGLDGQFHNMTTLLGLDGVHYQISTSFNPDRLFRQTVSKPDSLLHNMTTAYEQPTQLVSQKHKDIRMLSFSDKRSIEIIQTLQRRNELYARRHGYTYNVSAKTAVRKFSHPAWNRIELVLNALREGVDIIFWIDHDAYVNHGNITVESWFRKYPNKSFVIALEGPEFYSLNTGVFLVRNTPWAHGLFEMLLSPPKSCEVAMTALHCCWEQTCLSDLVKANKIPDWDSQVASIPSPEFNCRKIRKPREANCLQTGWVYHFMGQGGNKFGEMAMEYDENMRFQHQDPDLWGYQDITQLV